MDIHSNVGILILHDVYGVCLTRLLLLLTVPQYSSIKPLLKLVWHEGSMELKLKMHMAVHTDHG